MVALTEKLNLMALRWGIAPGFEVVQMITWPPKVLLLRVERKRSNLKSFIWQHGPQKFFYPYPYTIHGYWLN